MGTLTNAAMVAIHYNTIVHPFTLADNRHYVFYVFRVLMRREEIKYLAAPIYVLTGYVVIQTLGTKPLRPSVPKKGKATKPVPSVGCQTSFVVVWLITTALSLITAPLVEPRYCIIPWMMWRLRMISTNMDAANEDTPEKAENGVVYGTLVETLWFTAIGFGTGYMFLYRGFSWPQEPGKTQRFMW